MVILSMVPGLEITSQAHITGLFRVNDSLLDGLDLARREVNEPPRARYINLGRADVYHETQEESDRRSAVDRSPTKNFFYRLLVTEACFRHNQACLHGRALAVAQRVQPAIRDIAPRARGRTR